MNKRQKMISKERVAERLGISEQMVMKHARLLKIRPGRGPIKTKGGVQYKTRFTLKEFTEIEARHKEKGNKPKD